MAEVLLSTVDLDVFGGPTRLDVSVDFGQTGPRGSRIFAGPGDPNTFLVGQDVRLFDWFINTSPTGQTYSVMYQYVLQVGNPVWIEVLRLAPEQFGAILPVVFDNGIGTVSIPISQITAQLNFAIGNFLVNANIENINPVAQSFTTSLSGNHLVLEFNAVEYDMGSWVDLDGQYDIHTNVSFIVASASPYDGGDYS
jgi:hypothetical protein